MKLVKDYIDDRTVFYWVKNIESLEPVSPLLRSFVQAEEWWKEFMFTQFSGNERRRSTSDRRQDFETRQQLSQEHKKSTSDPGRRITDMTIKVHIDKHSEKTK
ncbi:MAG: hypothetical protein ACRBB6_12925 [Neptuniibacter sp.]